jgi:hypothetical protein
MNKTDPDLQIALCVLGSYTLAVFVCGFMTGRAWFLGEIRKLKRRLNIHTLASHHPWHSPWPKPPPRAAFLKRNGGKHERN